MKNPYYPFLKTLAEKPLVFSVDTVSELWTDPYVSRQMLKCHLDPNLDRSSRRHAFIHRSCEWILSHFGLQEGSTIADFGCGPGLYCQLFAEKGLDVTGIDFSANSLDYARMVASERRTNISYVQQNYLEFQSDLKAFDLIQMIMCDYCAIGPQKRKKLLNRWATQLKPAGRVLFDVYSLQAFEASVEQTRISEHGEAGFWSEISCVECYQRFNYQECKVTLDRFQIAEPERHRILYNWLQYFDIDVLKQEVGECGFEIDEVFSNVAGDPFDPSSDEYAVVLRKR